LLNFILDYSRICFEQFYNLIIADTSQTANILQTFTVPLGLKAEADHDKAP